MERQKAGRRALLALTLAAGMLSFTLWSGVLAGAPVFAPADRGAARLLIDPGHGGEDGGAVSVSGAKESGINLAIALKCDQAAGLFGIPVELVRAGEDSLADPGARTLREKKRSDLKARVERVNAARDGVLLSIHQNQFPGSSSSGAQVFYRPGEASKGWAEYTQGQLRQALNPENHRQMKEIPPDIYLMRHISCPAILVECGFLSNPEEDRLLQTEDYQKKLAAVLIGSYLGCGIGR